MATKSNDYAFIVGIDDYPSFNPLKGAKKDAEDFHQWFDGGSENVAAELNLTKTELDAKIKSNGLDSYNCKVVLSMASPLSPGNVEIDNALEILVGAANEALAAGRKPRRLYFYFSGHGLGLDTENIGMCYTSFKLGAIRANLDLKQYIEYLKLTELFDEIICILDCCRVRKINATGMPPMLSPGNPTGNAAKVRSLILYSCEYLSPAFEANTDGQVRGFFTTALVKGLKGEASVGNGLITYQSLLNYLYREVPRLSKQKQKPRHSADILLDEDFITLSDDPGEVKYDEENYYKLTIEKPLNNPNFQSAGLYNQYNESLWSDKRVSKTVSLPAGKYYVVSEFTDTCKTDEIILDGNKTHIIGFESVMVTPNHEYYSNPAKLASTHPTKSIGPDSNAGLLIFIRYQDNNNVDKNVKMNENLCLRDEKGNIITSFERDDLFHEDAQKQRYLQDGFLNYSVTAPEGLYFLSYTGKNKCESPVYLVRNRQTQVFLLFDKEPIFESGKVFMPERNAGYPGYSYQHSEVKSVDAATRFLQNPHGTIPVDLLSDLFNEKFSDPMKGLLAANILLKGKFGKNEFYDAFFKEQAQEYKDKKEDFFRFVIKNLTKLLGADFPDVMLIRLCTTDFMDDHKAEKFEFRRPPMISWGLQELMRRASLDSTLIPSDSFLVKIAPKLRVDSVFSGWEPVELPLERGLGDDISKDLESLDQPLEEWVVNGILQEVTMASKKDPDATLKRGFDKELAQKLSLPLSTIQYYMKGMVNMTQIDENLQHEFRIDREMSNKVMDAVNSFSAILKTPVLGDIEGLKFSQQQILKREGIKDLGNLADLKANAGLYQQVATKLNTDPETLNKWIIQAKGLLE